MSYIAEQLGKSPIVPNSESIGQVLSQASERLGEIESRLMSLHGRISSMNQCIANDKIPLAATMHAQALELRNFATRICDLVVQLEKVL